LPVIKIFLALGIFLFLSTSASAQTLAFQLRGGTQTRSVEELAKITPVVEVQTRSPIDDKKRRFKAFALKPLLKAMYGEHWKRDDDIVFTCTDGYQPSLPGAILQRHDAYLAFASADGQDFSIFDHGKVQDLGPYYLIWDNVRDEAFDDEQPQVWPFQVTALEPVPFKLRYAAMLPPARSSAQVRRGFLVFRNHCMNCHSINGLGGSLGPELNYPVNVTQYYAIPWLKRWIAMPRSIRYNATMPPLDAEAGTRDKMLNDLIAYLKAMVGKKVAPPR